jgi:hypothetical protein
VWLYRSVYDVITNSSLLATVSIFCLSTPTLLPPRLVYAEIYGSSGQTCCSVGQKLVFGVRAIIFWEGSFDDRTGVGVCVAASLVLICVTP